jgi:hypothetical protein
MEKKISKVTEFTEPLRAYGNIVSSQCFMSVVQDCEQEEERKRK